MTGTVSGGLFGLVLVLSSCVATVAAGEPGVAGPVEASDARATTRPAPTTAPARSGALVGAFSRLLAGMAMEHHRESGKMPPGATDVQFVPRTAGRYERIAPGLFDAPAAVFDDAANRTAATQALRVLSDADRALPTFTAFLYDRFADGELKGAELELARRVFEGHAAIVKQANAPTVVLRVGDDGKVEYAFRGRRVADADALADALAGESEKSHPLRIRASRDVPFSSVVRVFNLARQAGFGKIELAATDEPADRASADAPARPTPRAASDATPSADASAP